MKIDPALPAASSLRPVKKAPASLGSDFFSEIFQTTPPRLSLPLDMTQALLSLQETFSSDDQKRQKIAKGENVLNLLTCLQSDLLQGEICPDTLVLLQQMQFLGGEEVSDPVLRDILEEIEMRSLVILTQLELAIKKQTP